MRRHDTGTKERDRAKRDMKREPKRKLREKEMTSTSDEGKGDVDVISNEGEGDVDVISNDGKKEPYKRRIRDGATW
jgi:hypothetical protein